MELANFYKSICMAEEKTIDILKSVDVNNSIPETHFKYPGYTRLHFAAKRRALDSTIALLKQNADLVKQSTNNGFTPLHVAMNTTFIRKSWCSLIDEEGYHEEYRKNKSTELQEYNLMKILLSKQVEVNNILNPANKYGLTHFHIACIVNHAEAVEFFARAKEPLDQTINYNSDEDDDENYMKKYRLQGYTPLHCAIQYISVHAAEILLKYGANLHIKNGKDLSCVHMLIERIKNMTDFITMGKHSLCMPYLQEEITKIESIIKLVLLTRASDKIFVDDTGLTELHLACTLGNISLVENLLKLDVDVNMRVKNESKFLSGWTPLHVAACFNIETMILLLQNGADITIENSKGETALDLCAERFTPANVQLVLSTMSTLKNIVLSDNCTKLSDLLLAINDYNKFKDFMRNLRDVNLIIPLGSPIWAGYNLLHLCVSFNEKRIPWEDFQENLQLLEMAEEDALKQYNCTEEDETLYWKRIKLCLQYGCSVNRKNTKGQTAVHLAFSRLRGKAVVEELLRCSKENIVDQNNLSHLHIACAVGQFDVVKRYLSAGANVNRQVKSSFDWHDESQCENGTPINVRINSTPLHVAIAFGDKKLVEYLLKNKADVYIRDSLDLTPIHLVMFRAVDSKKIAQLIIKVTPNLRDSVSKVGLSHLHVAAYANDYETIERMLLEGAEVDRIIDANVERHPFLDFWAGKTPLLIAVPFNDLASMALLKGGANVHVKDLQGFTALQHMINDHLDDYCIKPFIKMLKMGKYDAEPSGLTKLHFACGMYDIDWAEKLLRKGAYVNARISAKGSLQGATPLYLLFVPAIIFDVNPDTVNKLIKLLLNSGADVTIKCNASTPIHLIYEEMIYNDFELDEDNELVPFERLLQIADLLLESQKSYNVNPTDNREFSHFHFACIRNNVKTVKKFLDCGVDVNLSIDPFSNLIGGFTPLHFALAHKSKEVAYLLLERGANVNAEDANGNKPLHVAIKKKFVDLSLIEAMLRRGADLCAENWSKETPMYCLLKSGVLTLQALEFFLIHGCSIKITNNMNLNHQGIIGLAIRSVAPIDLHLTLERFAQVSDLKQAIQSGFNAIQSIVAVRQKGKLSVDNYLGAFKFLMNIGCELDQQDTQGRTALHAAVSFYNLEAMDALLKLGADVNVVDNENESPFSDKVIQIDNTFDKPRKMDVVKSLSCHIWKLKFIGLHVNDSNLRRLDIVDQQIPLASLLEESCQDELRKAEEIEIYQSLTVKDFLSEWGAVMRYPRMGFDRQAIVNQFFESTVYLRWKFPELSGLLALQHRKALARMKLLEPVKKLILSICQIKLSDCLLDDILKYFTNNDLKHVYELGNQLFG